MHHIKGSEARLDRIQWYIYTRASPKPAITGKSTAGKGEDALQ
jgi:hypothetical protein